MQLQVRNDFRYCKKCGGYVSGPKLIPSPDLVDEYPDGCFLAYTCSCGWKWYEPTLDAKEMHRKESSGEDVK